MRGGLGNDTYVVDNAGDLVTENLDEGTDTVEASINYTLTANVENLTLTGSGNINGTGNDLNNLIIGNSGNNQLFGGDGNDTLIGGAGADTLDGGSGNDTASYATSTAGVTVNLATGLGLGGHAQGDVLISIENLIGSNHSDTLTGDSGINRLEGGAGNDTLDGGGGADTLIGGTGDDTYIINNTGVTITENAGEGTDTVISSINYTLGANLENLTLVGGATEGTGNNLNNVITGNGNNNILKGDAGNDTLVINATGLSTGTFDGGTDTDTLKILASSGATIDLRGIDNAKFMSIESVDISAQTNNKLMLNLDAIKSLVDPAPGVTPTLSVKLGTGDTIDFVADSGQQVFNNTTTKTMTIFGSAASNSLEQLAIINYA